MPSQALYIGKFQVEFYHGAYHNKKHNKLSKKCMMGLAVLTSHDKKIRGPDKKNWFLQACDDSRHYDICEEMS